MPPTETENAFSVIPDGFGGLETAVAEPDKTEHEEIDPTEDSRRESSPVESTDDLLQGGDRKERSEEGVEKRQPEKTPAQYAEERRQAKAEKERILSEYPELVKKKEELERRFTESQSEIEQLRAITEEVEGKDLIEQDTLESLRKENEMLRHQYSDQFSPGIATNTDEEYLTHKAAETSSLKSNIPRWLPGADGSKRQVNFEAVMKDPQRKGAVDAAVQTYAISAEENDSKGMSKAVTLLGSAIGGLDMDDEDTVQALDTALYAAAEPFAKAVRREQFLKERAYEIAEANRIQAIQQTAQTLKAPLHFDREALSKKLEEDPGHGWANFGVLINEMPEEFRDAVANQLERDAAVMGSLRFVPPPVPKGADAATIQKHQALIAASQKHVMSAAQYLAVGRAMIDGGMLAHLRAKVAEAEARFEEEAASRSIPSRESGRSGGGDEGANVDPALSAFGSGR